MLFALIVICLRPSPVYAQAQRYYVDDGRKISEVQLRDLDPEQIEEWKIILYKPGEHYGSGWGSITGKTVESVKNQLKATQEFDRVYARMFGGDPETDEFTSFNPSGPIAKLKRPTTMAKEAFVLLGKLNSGLKDLWDGHKKVKTLLATDFKGKDWITGAGKTAKEYMDNFKMVQRNVAQIIRSAEDINRSSKDTLREIDKANADIKKTAALASVLVGGNPVVGRWAHIAPEMAAEYWIEFKPNKTCVVKEENEEISVLKWKIEGREILIINQDGIEVLCRGTLGEAAIEWRGPFIFDHFKTVRTRK